MRDTRRRTHAAYGHTHEQAARRLDRLIRLWSVISVRLEECDDYRARRRLVDRLWRVTNQLRAYEAARSDVTPWLPPAYRRATWERKRA